MRLIILYICLLLFQPCFLFGQGKKLSQSEKDLLAKAYVQEHKWLALQEMQQFGIPASIKMGQALLESNCGRSELAKNANNHFGIKCKRTWKGKTYRYTDDAPDECFRKYDSVEASFHDHSVFLKHHYYNNYDHLFELSMYDYKAWATGLSKAGYATNPVYAKSLIELIERLELFLLDTQAAIPLIAQYRGGKEKVRLGHLTNYDEQQAMASLSNEEKRSLHAMTVARLSSEESKEKKTIAERKANKPKEPTIAQKKRESIKKVSRKKAKKKETKSKGKTQERYEGVWQFHRIKMGETIESIAALYDVDVIQLRKFNHLRSGDRPRIGEQIVLNRMNPDKPKLVN